MKFTIPKLGLIMPEAVAKEKGWIEGWRKYCNGETIRGKVGVYFVVLATYGAIYGYNKWKKNRPIKQATAEKKRKQWEKFEHDVKEWVANGRKLND